MKNWKSILLFVLIIFISIKYFALTIECQDNDFVFAGFILGFYLILFLILVALVVNIEIKKYKVLRDLKVFKLTTISFLLIIAAIGTHLFFSVRDLSNVNLEAGKDLDFNFIHLELRDDGTYKFTNGSGLGNSYFRGDYSRNDSIILIDTLNSDKLLKSNRLAIRNNQIFMIDSQHKIIDSTFYFNIY